MGTRPLARLEWATMGLFGPHCSQCYRLLHSQVGQDLGIYEGGWAPVGFLLLLAQLGGGKEWISAM
jgi:hypothetical protein